MDSEYNPLSTLLFNTEGGAIRSILAEGVHLTIGETILYAGIWFTLATVAYGIWVPAGIFLPAIIIGCSLGKIYADLT